MNTPLIPLLALALLAASASAAERDFSRLGKDLTPIGAERAGNADGSIPAWEGGLTQPPAGWTPQQGYVDPFPGDKPLFTITAANAAEHAAKLTPGLQALLKKYPQHYRMHGLPDAAHGGAAEGDHRPRARAGAQGRAERIRTQEPRRFHDALPDPAERPRGDLEPPRALRGRRHGAHRSLVPGQGQRRLLQDRLPLAAHLRAERRGRGTEPPLLRARLLHRARDAARHDLPGARAGRPGGRAALGVDLQRRRPSRAPRARPQLRRRQRRLGRHDRHRPGGRLQRRARPLRVEAARQARDVHPVQHLQAVGQVAQVQGHHRQAHAQRRPRALRAAPGLGGRGHAQAGTAARVRQAHVLPRRGQLERGRSRTPTTRAAACGASRCSA